jgi:hypothetical protein
VQNEIPTVAQELVLDCCPARPQEFEIWGRLKIDEPKNRPFFRVKIIGKRTRSHKQEKAMDEIRASGMEEYCSVLKF